MQNLLRHRRLAGLLILVATFAFVGCSEESPTGPQEPITFDGDDAETWTIQALEMVSGLATDAPDLVAGNFGNLTKAQGDEPTWNATEMAYVFTSEITSQEGSNTVTGRIDIWIQYRDGTGPVQNPVGATVIEARVTSGATIHTVGESSTSDVDYDFETTFIVSDLSGNDYAVLGNGSSTVDMSVVANEAQAHMQFDMGWMIDVSVPSAGCPTGTAQVTANGYQLDADYDGSNMVDWTLSGPNYQGSGSELLTDCSGSSS